MIKDDRPRNTLTQLSNHLEKLKQQMGLVLPKHMTPDRMARLALTAFNSDSKLNECSFQSVAAAVMIASQMGLEIGVGGQGWLVPYGKTATFVPGWQGLIELLNRSGRGTAWTGAVYQGDYFDWGLGDSPYVKHKPSGSKDELTHVYAIGRSKGSEWPVIEVWNVSAVIKHRDRYNKVGQKHYSFKDENNFEMYARKVALLQVLKYLPKSIELQAAIDASHAADVGDGYTVDADFVVSVPNPPRVESEMDELASELKSRGSSQPKSSPQAESKAKPEPESDSKPPEKSAGDDSDAASQQERTIIQDYKEQIAQCESHEDCVTLGLVVKGSKRLDLDEKKYLGKLIGRRDQELI